MEKTDALADFMGTVAETDSELLDMIRALPEPDRLRLAAQVVADVAFDAADRLTPSMVETLIGLAISLERTGRTQ